MDANYIIQSVGKGVVIWRNILIRKHLLHRKRLIHRNKNGRNAYLFLVSNEQISIKKGLLSTDRFYLCYMKLIGRRHMELNRLDYVIMKLLKKKNCISHFESMTLQEIMCVTGTSRPTTYRKMMNLCKLGYVEK